MSSSSNRMIVEESASLSPTRRRIDRAATWAAWAAWVALLVPAATELFGAPAQGAVVDAVQQALLYKYAPTFLGSVATVTVTIGLWSLYNQRRNRRTARGGHLAWLGARRVAEFYAVDLRQLFGWQQSRRLIVTHDDVGSVHHVEAEGKPLAATAVVTREQPPLVAANEEAQDVSTVDEGNVVRLPVAVHSIPSIAKSPDKRPTRLTYNGRVYYT